MCFRAVCAVVFAGACACASFAQEAFDPEKTKVLFEKTEWHTGHHGGGWSATFAADGRLVWTTKHRQQTETFRWTPSGLRSVKGDNKEWTLAPDGKELYVTGDRGGFDVFFRGNTPEYPFLWPTLANTVGFVWVKQGTQGRETFAFNVEKEIAWGRNGEDLECGYIWSCGGGSFQAGGFYFMLVQDEKGERTILREGSGATFKLEPAQPGDPLPPVIISHAKSPLGGTSWCRMDGKGNILQLTFSPGGTVSDSRFRGEKPEWTPYDNGRVRYTVKGETRRLMLSEDKKRLTRVTDKVYEVWFPGRQLPMVGLTERKQMKDRLCDPSKAWVSWDNTKKTVYLFDEKTANVSISIDDVKQPTVRWDAPSAEHIIIGKEAFVIEGDWLERIEPRLTLKQVARDSVK